MYNEVQLKRKCMKTFKVGDRVKFVYDKTTDEGVIVRKHQEYKDVWWILWDSNDNLEWSEEHFLTLIETEFTPATPVEKCYEDLIKEAALLAIYESNYNTAIRTLKLLLNEKYAQSI